MIAQLDLFASVAPVAIKTPAPVAIAQPRHIEAEPNAAPCALTVADIEAGETWERYKALSAPLSVAERLQLDGRLQDALGRLRRSYNADSAKEKAKAKARRLTLAHVEMAHRVAFPRPFAVLASETWDRVSEIDRLLSDPRATKEFAERIRQLRYEVDGNMIEANGGTTFGVKVNDGPKRLMKALRVRARREGRWPMWDVEGRFRFQWKGLTLICSTRFGMGIHIDKDRHAPGTMCHSPTGFRSFTNGGSVGMTIRESAIRMLDAYFAAPPKDGLGMGGQLARYVPWDLTLWAQHKRDEALRDASYRAECPAMTKAEDRPAYWEAHDRKQAEREAAIRAQGIDPYEFFPEFKPPAQTDLF